MADPILYNKVNRRLQIVEPQLVRYRSRYRGQRESWKINNELRQILYDLRKLYEKYTDMDTVLQSHFAVIESGGTVPASYNGSPIVLDGTADAALRLDKVLTRIRALEGGRSG